VQQYRALSVGVDHHMDEARLIRMFAQKEFRAVVFPQRFVMSHRLPFRLVDAVEINRQIAVFDPHPGLSRPLRQGAVLRDEFGD